MEEEQKSSKDPKSQQKSGSITLPLKYSRWGMWRMEQNCVTPTRSQRPAEGIKALYKLFCKKKKSWGFTALCWVQKPEDTIPKLIESLSSCCYSASHLHTLHVQCSQCAILRNSPWLRTCFKVTQCTCMLSLNCETIFWSISDSTTW